MSDGEGSKVNHKKMPNQLIIRDDYPNDPKDNTLIYTRKGKRIQQTLEMFAQCTTKGIDKFNTVRLL